MAEDVQTAKRGSTDDAIPKEDEKASPGKLSITMDKRFDLAVAVGVALVGVLILIGARNIRAGSIPDPITSRGLANITGVLLIIFGIILSVLRLRIWSAMPGNLVPEEGQTDEEGYPASTIRYSGIVLASLLWVWLVKPLGFLFAMPLALLAMILFMNVRSRMKLIAFPILFTLVTWVAFSQLLGIIMPLGPLTSFARSLGLVP
jgi:hypothetical protein